MFDRESLLHWAWPLVHWALWLAIAAAAYDRGHSDGLHSAPEFVDYQLGRHERAVEFMEAFDGIDLSGRCGEGPS